MTGETAGGFLPQTLSLPLPLLRPFAFPLIPSTLLPMVPTVVVPVMTLGNCVFLPQQLLPLRIFEPRYRKMLKETLAGSRMFAISQLDEESLSPDNDEPPCPFTCVGRIVGHVEL